MTVLGMETATSVCGVALVRDGMVIRETSLTLKNAHAEKLLGQINGVLHDADLAIGALGGVAVSIGPGSFTGLRIGLSVAKGLVYATGMPLVGVPTLEALAHHAQSIDPLQSGEAVLAALDARRDEVYCQLFEQDGTSLTPAWDARDMTVGELWSELGGRRVLVTGDATGKVIAAAPAKDGPRAASESASQCSAASVALLGEQLLLAGVKGDPASMEPRYIKEFFLKVR